MVEHVQTSLQTVMLYLYTTNIPMSNNFRKKLILNKHNTICSISKAAALCYSKYHGKVRDNYG